MEAGGGPGGIGDARAGARAAGMGRSMGATVKGGLVGDGGEWAQGRRMTDV